MTLAERLSGIHSGMAAAAVKSGRSASAVRLCAVSKTFPASAVEEVAAAGQLLFGENRVQECMDKIPHCPAGLSWHLIGHLQSNKVRKILPLVACVQSVDSVALARDISRIAGDMGVQAHIMLQVNISGDDAKHGLAAEATMPALDQIRQMPNIMIDGLMTIPRLDLSPEAARPHFAALRTLAEKLRAAGGIALPELSMGMSADYAVAIEEGATLVRVGSALFGGR